MLTPRLDGSVAAHSAGTRALIGRPIDARMALLLQERGFNTGNFSSRQVTGEMVADAWIVITMTAAQRSTIASMVPDAARRVFTLVELGALLEVAPAMPPGSRDDAERWSFLAEYAGHFRDLNPIAGPVDIADPYRRSDRHYEKALNLMTRALEPVLRVTAAPSSS